MLWFWWGWSSIPKVPKIGRLQRLFTFYIIPKKVRNGVHFEHADKHRSFYKLALLIEKARQKYHNCFCMLLWRKTFRYFARVQSCLLLLVFGWLWSKMGTAFRIMELMSRMNWWNELIFCMLIQILGAYPQKWGRPFRSWD